MENFFWGGLFGILGLLLIVGLSIGVKENLRRCGWCPKRAWGKPHRFVWIYKASGAEVRVCDPCFWAHYQRYADQAALPGAEYGVSSVIPADAFGEYRMHPDTSLLLWMANPELQDKLAAAAAKGAANGSR